MIKIICLAKVLYKKDNMLILDVSNNKKIKALPAISNNLRIVEKSKLYIEGTLMASGYGSYIKITDSYVIETDEYMTHARAIGLLDNDGSISVDGKLYDIEMFGDHKFEKKEKIEVIGTLESLNMRGSKEYGPYIKVIVGKKI